MLKKKMKLVTLSLAIVLILSQMTAFAAEKPVALEIKGVGVGTELKLTMEDLKAVPAEYQIAEDYMYNSKGGEKTVKVKGVSLEYLLSEKAMASAENAEVTFKASDDYAVDPQTLQDIKNLELKYVVAYETDGVETGDLTIYRKQKEVGEFNTVYKHIIEVTVGEAMGKVEETEPKNEVDENKKEDTTTSSTSAALAVFTDITEEYKFAEEAINALVAKGIVAGKGDGLYAPQDDFTRAQFCKMAVLALNLGEKEYTGGFSDVSKTEWYPNYIQSAVDAGLFKGSPDGTFKPNDPITRQEMASVIARASVQLDKVSAEKLTKFTMDKSNYTDKQDVQDWASNAVAWLEAQGVFKDVAADKFEPAKDVNRAEAAVVVYRALVK